MAKQSAQQTSQSVRDSITDALVALANEKPFSSITTTELCQTAGVSRMAFYRNFQSKEEVLSIRLSELVEEYKSICAPLLEQGELWYSTGHLTEYFSIMQRNKTLVNALFNTGMTGLLSYTIKRYLDDTWGNGTRESEYALISFAGSLVACYKPWADGGFQESPLQMAQLMNQFFLIPAALSSKDASTPEQQSE